MTLSQTPEEIERERDSFKEKQALEYKAGNYRGLMWIAIALIVVIAFGLILRYHHVNIGGYCNGC